MTRVRVYISTTEAPAEIQRIAEEDPEIRSVMCLDGKAVELPVSAAYDSFVRKPTGVIEAEFGHPSYRVDVGARISEGLSWQLGIYLAHALAREGRLASKGDPAERVVLATGEVDRDLHVRAVDHIADKARVAAPLFAQATAEDGAVIMFVPTANRQDLDAQIAGCKVVPVETVHDALAWLGVDRLPRAAAAASLDEAPAPSGAGRSLEPVIEKDRTGPPRRRGRWPIALAAVLAMIAGLAWWLVDLGLLEWREIAASGDHGRYQELDARLLAIEEGDCAPCRWVAAVFERNLDLPAPDSAGLTIGATAWTVPRFRTCRVMEFQPDLVEKTPVRLGLDKAFAAESSRRLCAIDYWAENAGPDLSVILVAAVDAGEGAVSFRGGDEREARRLATGEKLSLVVNMPQRVDRPITVTVTAAVGGATARSRTDWLFQAIEDAMKPDAPAAPLERRLARVGLTLVQAAHRIEAPPPRFQ